MTTLIFVGAAMTLVAIYKLATTKRESDDSILASLYNRNIRVALSDTAIVAFADGVLEIEWLKELGFAQCDSDEWIYIRA